MSSEALTALSQSLSWLIGDADAKTAPIEYQEELAHDALQELEDFSKRQAKRPKTATWRHNARKSSSRSAAAATPPTWSQDVHLQGYSCVPWTAPAHDVPLALPHAQPVDDKLQRTVQELRTRVQHLREHAILTFVLAEAEQAMAIRPCCLFRDGLRGPEVCQDERPSWLDCQLLDVLGLTDGVVLQGLLRAVLVQEPVTAVLSQAGVMRALFQHRVKIVALTAEETVGLVWCRVPQEDETELGIVSSLVTQLAEACQTICTGGAVVVPVLDVLERQTLSLLFVASQCFQRLEVARPMGAAPWSPVRLVLLMDAKPLDAPERQRSCRALQKCHRHPLPWPLLCPSQKFFDFWAHCNNASAKLQQESLQRLIWYVSLGGQKKRAGPDAAVFPDLKMADRRHGAVTRVVPTPTPGWLTDWVQARLRALATIRTSLIARMRSLCRLSGGSRQIASLSAVQDGFSVQDCKSLQLAREYVRLENPAEQGRLFACRLPPNARLLTYSAKHGLREADQTAWTSQMDLRGGGGRTMASLLVWLRSAFAPFDCWVHLAVSLRTGLVLLLDVLRISQKSRESDNLHELTWFERQKEARLLAQHVSPQSPWALVVPEPVDVEKLGHGWCVILGAERRNLVAESVLYREEAARTGSRRFAVRWKLMRFLGS